MSVGLARLSRLPAPFPVGSLGAGGTHTKPPPPRRSEDPLRLRAGPGRRRRVPPRHPGDRSLWMRSPPPLQNTAWGKSIPRPFPGGGRRGRGVAVPPVRGRAGLCLRVPVLQHPPGPGQGQRWLPAPSGEGLPRTASDKSSGPLAFSSLA